MMKWWISPHANYGPVFFDARTIDKEEVVGYYYGFLVYADVANLWNKSKMYGERAVQVTAETLR